MVALPTAYELLLALIALGVTIVLISIASDFLFASTEIEPDQVIIPCTKGLVEIDRAGTTDYTIKITDLGLDYTENEEFDVFPVVHFKDKVKTPATDFIRLIPFGGTIINLEVDITSFKPASGVESFYIGLYRKNLDCHAKAQQDMESDVFIKSCSEYLEGIIDLKAEYKTGQHWEWKCGTSVSPGGVPATPEGEIELVKIEDIGGNICNIEFKIRNIGISPLSRVGVYSYCKVDENDNGIPDFHDLLPSDDLQPSVAWTTTAHCSTNHNMLRVEFFKDCVRSITGCDSNQMTPVLVTSEEFPIDCV